MEKDSVITMNFHWERFNTDVEVEFNDTYDILSSCQNETFENLKNNLPKIENLIFEKIFLFYSESYKYYIGNDTDETSPDYKIIAEIIPQPTDSKSLLKNYKPTSIYIPKEGECKVGKFGIYFDCTWDINNSVGVRVIDWIEVEAGNGDIAFWY